MCWRGFGKRGRAWDELSRGGRACGTKGGEEPGGGFSYGEAGLGQKKKIRLERMAGACWSEKEKSANETKKREGALLRSGKGVRKTWPRKRECRNGTLQLEGSGKGGSDELYLRKIRSVIRGSAANRRSGRKREGEVRASGGGGSLMGGRQEDN